MTKEERLEQAYRDYTVGIIYKCANNGKTHTVEKQDFKHGYIEGDIFAEDFKGCLFTNGQWAEIISKPSTTDSLDLNHFLDEVAREYEYSNYYEASIANIDNEYYHIKLEAHKRFHAYQLEVKDKELAEAREEIKELRTISIKHFEAIRDWDDHSEQYWYDPGEIAKDALRMIKPKLTNP